MGDLQSETKICKICHLLQGFLAKIGNEETSLVTSIQKWVILTFHKFQPETKI